MLEAHLESEAYMLPLQVAYQRFYEALVARLTPEPEELSHRPSGTRNLMAVSHPAAAQVLHAAAACCLLCPWQRP